MTHEIDATRVITSRVVANNCGISQTTAHACLTAQLGSWQRTGKRAKLTPEAELIRVTESKKLLYNMEQKWGENYFRRVIFSDETFVQFQSSSLARIGTYGEKIFVDTVKYPKKVNV